jgi:aryl-alcohol dehydrogenase-like predicted oxidoreductase
MTSLDHYRLLGRSGLRVSPIALGTMTFGQDWGWGADAGEARRIFDLYVDQGGNFIDTAVNYTDGASERIVGEFIKDKRDRLVLATKFTMARGPGNPNSGGNHRLNMLRSVEQSLRQLDTDRIDLLYLHGWDMTTQPDEVMRGLDDLVRSGKIHYVGICNTPAWRISQMLTSADMRGWSPFVALQIEYSLIERTVEHELIPMAAALGMGGAALVAARRWRADRQVCPVRCRRRARREHRIDTQGCHCVIRPSQCAVDRSCRCRARCGRRGRRDPVAGSDCLDAREPRGHVACHGRAHIGPGERQSRRPQGRAVA